MTLSGAHAAATRYKVRRTLVLPSSRAVVRTNGNSPGVVTFTATEQLVRVAPFFLVLFLRAHLQSYCIHGNKPG